MAIADRNIEQQAPISAGEAAQAASSMTASSLGLVAQDGPGAAAASSSPSSSGLVAGPSAMSTAANLKALGGSKKASEIAGRISGSAKDLKGASARGTGKPAASAAKAVKAIGNAGAGTAVSADVMGSKTPRDASDEVAAEASGKAGAATKTLVGAAVAVGGKKAAGKARAMAKRGREKSWKAVTESWRGFASPTRRAASSAPKAAYLSSGRGARVKKAATSAAHAAQAAARRVAAGMRTVGNPVLAVSLSVILTFTLAVTALAAAGSSGGSGTGSLEGTEAELAGMLKAYGLSNVETAAIMGNMYAESGYDSHSTDGTGLGDSIGILQFTDEEKAAYLSWCSKNGKTWDEYAPQLEWTFSNAEGTSTGYWKKRWATGLMKSGYYIGDCGVPSSYSGNIIDASGFESCTDVSLATYAWMAGYERPKDTLSHYDTRRDKAQEVYSALQSGGATYLGSGTAAQAASYALSKKGCPYVWGAIGPNTFDCSGLVYWAYNQAGVKISRLTAQGQYSSQTTHISKSQLQVGDLVFFGSSTSSIHHVGIYIGSNEFVHAPQSGDVVKTTSLSARRDLIACGRVKG